MDAIKQEIVSLGGIKVIIRCLDSYPFDCHVIQRACWALLTLASHDAIAVKITNEGGIDKILASIKNCVNDPKVLQYGCWAIANICWNDQESKRRAIKLGACALMDSICNKYMGDSKV
jgi:hypothetical protein